MRLLTPLGLLALLSIVALIIIYIIRPNYQQKFISTTFVWKLSLKYRKKKIPTSKLRNIILIIIQILILTLAAAILTTPSKILQMREDSREVILIIDSSASMRTGEGETSRFKRAVEEARTLADATIANDGTVSLVLADDTPEFAFLSIKKDSRAEMDKVFADLLDDELDLCSYSVANLQGAIDLCANKFAMNSSAVAHVFTDAQFVAHNAPNVEIIDVTEPDEWNAAILSGEAEKSNGFYYFVVEVACYGKSQQLDLTLEVEGVNGSTSFQDNVSAQFSVDCNAEQTIRVVFLNEEYHADEAELFEADENTKVVKMSTTDKVNSFSSVNVALEVGGGLDDLVYDNGFSIYGGDPYTVDLEYYSYGYDPVDGTNKDLRNPFITQALYVFRSYYSDKGWWNIEPKFKTGNKMELDGYDFYIFEHTMPASLPTDGIVMLFDPNEAPVGAGFTVQRDVKLSGSLDAIPNDDQNFFTRFNAGNVTVSSYKKIRIDDEYARYVDESTGRVEEFGYKVLATIDGDPLIFFKNEGSVKVFVLAFNIHNSNIGLTPMMSFFYDLFANLLPPTVEKHYFEVGEKVVVNSRGEEVVVSGFFDGTTKTVNAFPTEMTFDRPGLYRLTQNTYFNDYIEDSIYVKAPAVESNIFRVEKSLQNPYTIVNEADFFGDLMLYFAIALAALLIAEWILQAFDNM